MKTTRTIRFVLFCLCGFSFVPEANLAQSFNMDKPLGELERSMEANLTWNLQNALLVYYPETKFVVNAKVKLQKVEPKRVLPKLPDALLSKDLTNLPGLPYIPESFEPGQEPQESVNLRRHLYDNRYQIEGIRVNVLVDRSLNEHDWSFIRRFVTLTANLEASRGDQVRIEGLVFPEKTDFFPTQKQSQIKPIENKPVYPQTETKQAGLDWLPYVFAAGLATFLLILFLVGQRMLVKHLRQPGPGQNVTDLQAQKPKLLNALPGPVAEQKPKSEEISAIDVLKTATIDAIVGTPAASAKVLNRWIDEQGDTGVDHVAIVLATVSKSLLDLLEPYLGQETAETVQKRMTELSQSDIDEHAESLLKQFDEEIRRLALKNKYENDSDALSFLHQMSDDQLQHLLKPLKVGVVAIVLAQLRTNRAAKVLSNMDQKERKAVLAAMGNIERIPSDVYQHIARQLATRAHDLKKMRYVRANGVDAMVNVLDHLDESTQNETLDYIQTRDVELAQKVSKRFMTFNQLLEMSNDKLREVALEVDRDTLAKSLVRLDEKTIENIINSLPEKLGELVRASLESHNDLSEDEVGEARRTLMRSLRHKKSPKVVS